MPSPLQRFWSWYERHYLLNVGLASGLFVLQLVHLYWLTTHVVLQRLTGVSYFDPGPVWQYLIIIVDYTEIPAIITTSVYYFYQLQKGFSWKPVLLLIALNSQWLHLFWITDEFVVNQFSGRATILPVWLAWVAILIDYLELPVIFDTLREFLRTLKKQGLARAMEKLKEA